MNKSVIKNNNHFVILACPESLLFYKIKIPDTPALRDRRNDTINTLYNLEISRKAEST